MKIFIFLMLLVAPQVCSAIVLSGGLAGSTSGATPVQPAPTLGNTAKIQVGQSQTQLGICDQQGNLVMTTQNVDRVAMGVIQSSTADIITTSSSASGAVASQCANMATSFTNLAAPSGIELFGRTIVDKHSSATGYKNKIYGPAIGSFNTNVDVATGNAELPSYNSRIDANPVNNNAYTRTLWDQSGIVSSLGSNDYVSTRASPLVAKEFAYMTVKLPNYKQTWQNQMNTATVDFNSQNNSLLSNFGLSFTTPLPTDYQAQINKALGVGTTNVNNNLSLAANAQQNAAAAATAGAAVVSVGVARIAGVSVPASQQPLLQQINKNYAAALIETANYNSYTASYVASNQTLLNAQAAYNAEAAKVAAAGTSSWVYLSGPLVYHAGGGTCSYPPTYSPSVPASYTCPNGVSSPLCYKPPKPSVYSGGCSNGVCRYNCHGNGRAVLFSKVTTPGSPGPNPAVLAQLQAQIDAAKAAMQKYKALQQKALAQANSLNASVQADFSLLKSSLTATATAQRKAAASFTGAATGAANANTNGMSSSASLAALDSLISGLGNLLNMANNVTNRLTNIVTLPEVVTAGTKLTKAFDMLANLDGGMQMGDALGTSTEVANASINTGGVAPGAGNAIGIINNNTAGATATNERSSILVNARKDTPYRALIIINKNLKTLRTASAMIDSAIQASGMGVAPTSPIPDPGDITIPPVMGSASMTNGGVLRHIGVNFTNAINEI